MRFNFSVVLCRKKNPLWGYVVDGRFQPEGWPCWVEPRLCRGSARHGHPEGWKRPSTTEPHIRFLLCMYYVATDRKVALLFIAVSRQANMSTQWLKNMLGLTLTEEEQKYIPYPRLELTIHVTCKAIQTFVVIGTCLLVPISVMWSAEARSWTEVQGRMASYCKTAIMLALFLGPLVTYLRIRNAKKEEEVTDRCYRLRKNRLQVVIDRGTILGATTGVVMATFGLFSSAMFGFSICIPIGIVVAIVYIRMSWL